jgi:hypothetical protein
MSINKTNNSGNNTGKLKNFLHPDQRDHEVTSAMNSSKQINFNESKFSSKVNIFVKIL